MSVRSDLLALLRDDGLTPGEDFEIGDMSIIDDRECVQFRLSGIWTEDGADGMVTWLGSEGYVVHDGDTTANAWRELWRRRPGGGWMYVRRRH